MFQPKIEDAGRSPAKPVAKAQEPFLSFKSVAITIATSIIVSILGYAAHNMMTARRVSLRRHLLLAEQRSPGDEQHVVSDKEEPVPVTTDFYLQCNPSLAPAELSGHSQDSVFQTSGHTSCGQEEAVILRRVLQQAGYSYKAVEPKPAIYPAFLEKALPMLDLPLLKAALHQHLSETELLGHLGTLVKFFAWGLPVSRQQLLVALGEEGIYALRRCNMIRPCTVAPSMWTSAVMLMPLSYTNVTVATDWASHSTEGMSEAPVPIVQPVDLAFAHNTPDAHGLKVVDLGSPGGVQGIVSIKRGARAITFFDQNLRNARFARFNAFMNHVGDQLQVFEGNGQLLPPVPKGIHYDMLLANPIFSPLPPGARLTRWRSHGGHSGLEDISRTLASTSLLNQHGSFVFLLEIPNPEHFSERICKDFNLAGFTGSVVWVSPADPISTYTLEHLDAFGGDPGTGIFAQVENLRAHHIENVSYALWFGWKKTNIDMGSKTACGGFQSVSVTNLDILGGDFRPCSFGKRGCPQLEPTK